MSSGFDGRERRPGREHEARLQFREKNEQELEREGPEEREAAKLREAMDR